jgi:hypothetical protein
MFFSIKIDILKQHRTMEPSRTPNKCKAWPYHKNLKIKKHRTKKLKKKKLKGQQE